MEAQEARRLLDSIDVSNVVGLRDRALIAVMCYTFARVSAVCALAMRDYFPAQGGKRWCLRFRKEKGGKVIEMPCHHNLEEYLDAYLEAAGSEGERTLPLFRRVHRHDHRRLSDRAMRPGLVWEMVKRRARVADIRSDISCHTFRATGITAYLQNGGSLEKAQKMAGHASARTTKLYDRRDDKLTLDEVERIVI